MQRKVSSSLVLASQSGFAVRLPMRLANVGMLILGIIVTGCDAYGPTPDAGQDNPAVGFDLNNNTGSVRCAMCGAWSNQTNFDSGIQHSGDIMLSVTVDRAINAKRDATGNLPNISTL
jgi:hypothetical protein